MPDTTLEILTLGRFNISINGKPVATKWPDESLREFFCSLISPLDIYFTWDRLCRSLLGMPETRASRRQLEEVLIRPLNGFLIKEIGFTPLVVGLESIKIDLQRIYVDAQEFHQAVVEGLKLLSLGDQSVALDKLGRAKSLYAGCYLPGMPGKIITNTRNELESLFRIALMESVHHTRLRPGQIDPARPESVRQDCVKDYSVKNKPFTRVVNQKKPTAA